MTCVAGLLATPRRGEIDRPVPLRRRAPPVPPLPATPGRRRPGDGRPGHRPGSRVPDHHPRRPIRRRPAPQRTPADRAPISTTPPARRAGQPRAEQPRILLLLGAGTRLSYGHIRCLLVERAIAGGPAPLSSKENGPGTF